VIRFLLRLPLFQRDASFPDRFYLFSTFTNPHLHASTLRPPLLDAFFFYSCPSASYHFRMLPFPKPQYSWARIQLVGVSKFPDSSPEILEYVGFPPGSPERPVPEDLYPPSRKISFFPSVIVSRYYPFVHRIFLLLIGDFLILGPNLFWAPLCNLYFIRPLHLFFTGWAHPRFSPYRPRFLPNGCA